jgi:hypothetical protein
LFAKKLGKEVKNFDEGEIRKELHNNLLMFENLFLNDTKFIN